jgi:hypothetical protein
MKNIHVIATNKPSRLLKTIPKGNLILSKLITSGSHWENQNIYITSDEEIKEERCWVINPMNKKESVPHSKWGKLIIMTTDQDLIKDGVQAIDDTFLEWFIKNSSCEYVDLIGLRKEKGYEFLGYEIIIPSDEPKQKLEKYSERFDNDKSAIGNPDTWGKRIVEEANYNMKKEILAEMEKLEEPKQDALNHFLSTSDVIIKDPQKWDFNKQETTLKEMGKKVAEYCKQYVGTDKYDVAMLAIEFGYNLNLDWDEK